MRLWYDGGKALKYNTARINPAVSEELQTKIGAGERPHGNRYTRHASAAPNAAAGKFA